MFETVDQLKTFISWCRDNGVTSFKDDKIAFVVTPDLSKVFDSDEREERANQDQPPQPKGKLPKEKLDLDDLLYSAR